MAPFWEFRVHNEPNPNPLIGNKPRPSMLLIPEPVDPPSTPRPHPAQLPRPSAPLPRVLNQPLWSHQPPPFLFSRPVASMPEPIASSLAPPPAPRPAQGRKPRQRPPRQPKLWDLLPELPPAPRPYAPPRPSAPTYSAPPPGLAGQPSVPTFWEPVHRKSNRHVSIGFPTAVPSNGVVDLSTWGTGRIPARGADSRGARERQREVPQIPADHSANARKKQERKRESRKGAQLALSDAQPNQIQTPLQRQLRDGLAAPLIAAPSAASSKVAPRPLVPTAAPSCARLEETTQPSATQLSLEVQSALDQSFTRQHRDSCACVVDYSSLWTSVLSTVADITTVIGDVAALVAPQSAEASERRAEPAVSSAMMVTLPGVASAAALAGKGAGRFWDQSPSSVLQTPALSDTASEPSPDIRVLSLMHTN